MLDYSPCFVRIANPFVNLKLHLCHITLRIKTKTISRSVISSQILQKVKTNIFVHWKFWRKFGSASHLCSCKSLSDVLILGRHIVHWITSSLQVYYKKTPSSAHQIVFVLKFDLHNMYWTCSVWIIDARISASNKDLPVPIVSKLY